MEDQEQQQDAGPPKTVKIVVLMFAKARELAGSSSLELDLPQGSTTADAVRELIAKFPQLEEISPTSIVALNHEYVSDPVQLTHGDEVALIPPVSGG